MKTTIFKRILPVFLSLIMLLGTLTPLATVNAVSSTEMTVDKIVSTEWTGDGWAIVVGLAEPLEGVSAWIGAIYGMTYSLNGGAETDLSIETVDAEQLIFNIPASQNPEGTTLNLGGTGVLRDWGGNVIIEALAFAQPVTLTGTASGWKLGAVAPEIPEIPTVTVTELVAEDSIWADVTNSWNIYLRLAAPLAGAESLDWAEVSGMTYRVNEGAEKPLTMYAGVGAPELLCLVLQDADLPKTVAAGTKVTVDGVAAIGESQFKFAEAVTFTKTEAGWELGETAPETPEVPAVTIAEVSDATAWMESQASWHIYLRLAEPLSGFGAEDWPAFTGLTYAVGENAEQALTCYAGAGALDLLCLVINDAALPQDTAPGTKVTLKGEAAMALDSSNRFKLAEPVVLVKTEDGWALEGEEPEAPEIPEVPTVTVTELVADDSIWADVTNSWNIYLRLAAPLAGAESLDWAEVPGMTYRVNEGVEKPLTMYAGVGAPELLCLVLQDADLPKTVAAGTKVTVDGVAAIGEGQFKFAEPVILVKTEDGWALEGVQQEVPDPVMVTVKSVFADGTAWVEAQSSWHISLRLSEKLEGVSVDQWAQLEGMTYAIGKNAAKSATVYAGTEATDLLCMVIQDSALPKNVAEGTRVILDGTAAMVGNKSYQLKFAKPVTLVMTVAGWTLEELLPTYTNITVTDVNYATGYLDNPGIWYVYLHTDNKMPGKVDSYFNGLKLEVNGRTYDVVAQHALHEDTLCFPIERSWLSQNAANGTTVTLKSGKGVQLDTGLGINLTRDVTLYKFFDTLTLEKPTTDTEYTDITISGMPGAIGFVELANAWCMELVPIQKLPGEEGSRFYYIDAVLNDKELQLKGTKQGECILIEIPNSILPKNTETATLTFKGGSKAVGGHGEYGIHLTNDHTVYLFNGMWSDEQFDKIKEVELFCTRLFNVAEQESRFDLYFYVNGEFPGKAWYNVFSIPVLLDGKEIEASMYKADSPAGKILYVGLPKDGTDIQEGSKMTIQAGTVATSGGYQITLTKDFHITYINGMWVEYRESDVQAPEAQNLWDVARFDEGYIPVSIDGTVMMSGEQEYNSILSTEKMMDFTVGFSGKKLYNDAESSSFSLVLRGTPISADDPISVNVLNGYVITFEGYECTEQTNPNEPELWGTRPGYVYVWKNGYNLSLKDQYCIGMYNDTRDNPYYKYNEPYNYEVSIYNISETVVCIELKINGELAYKCYDEAGMDPSDPAINPGVFGIYGIAPTVYGGETVELETVIAEKTECYIGDEVGVAVTYPSILAGAEFTVDQEGAVIESGKFIPAKTGTYTVSAKYNGKSLEPVTITVLESAVEEKEEVIENQSNLVPLLITVGVIVVAVAGAAAAAIFLIKKKKKAQ